jgi:TusE/DsrC/DsvC family sulfur relay protein
MKYLSRRYSDRNKMEMNDESQGLPSHLYVRYGLMRRIGCRARSLRTAVSEATVDDAIDILRRSVMQTMEIQGRAVEFGAKGFLVNFDDWDEALAQALAKQEGLALGECHWKAIHFIRKYYQENEIPPTPKVMIREIGDELHEYRCTYKTLKQMFPGGGCKQACRLAGLPDYYCHAC